MEILKKIILLLMIGVFGQQGFAQMSTINSGQPRGIYSIKGDYFFEHQNLIKAIDYYRKSVKEKPKDVLAMLRMAEAYDQTGDLDSAVFWFQKAFNINSEIEAAYILEFIYVLLDQKKYDEAIAWSYIYNDKVEEELSAKGSLNAVKDTTIYFIKKLEGINSPTSDLDPLPHQDRLFFSSDRFSSDELTDEVYNLYGADTLADDSFGSIKPFHKKINSKLNEGPFAIAQKTNTLYFTRNDVLKGSTEESMSIYYSDVPTGTKGKVNIKQLSFKNFNHNIGHPTLNSNGTVMYFIADTRKGESGYDIYKSELRDENWSTPMILGASINTNGIEAYPFLHNDSILYFASNRPGGLGGFDMYKVNLFDKQAQTENLGSQVNTPSDELGLIIKENINRGFLSSNRPGGLGGYDLYGMDLINLKLIEEESDTLEPVSISLFTSIGQEITLIGNSTGNFLFSLLTGMNYGLIIDKVNYAGGTDTGAKDIMNSGGSDETLSTLDLADGEMYNFLIQKFVEVDANPVTGENDKKIQDILGQPGDLITFRFIPDFSPPTDPNQSQHTTSIRYKGDKVNINKGDTIVFGYVVEEMPKAPEVAPELIADNTITDINLIVPPVEKTADTTLLADQILANPSALLQQPNQDMDSTLILTEDQTEDQNQEREVMETQDDDQVELAVKTVEEDPKEKETDIQKASLGEPGEQRIAPADVEAPIEGQQKDNKETVLLLAGTKKSVDSISLKPDLPVEELEIAEATSSEQSTIPEAGKVEAADAENVGDHQDDASFVDVAIVGQADPEKSFEDPQANDSPVVELEIAEAITPEQSASPEEIMVEAVDSEMGIDSEEDLSEMKRPEESSAPPMVEDQSEKDTKVDQDLQYRVQIAASRVELSEAHLKKIYLGTLRPKSFEEEGYFKYYIAQVSELIEAKKIRNECGVDEAFIAMYRGGVKQGLVNLEETSQTTMPDDDWVNDSEAIDILKYRVQIVASKSQLNEPQLKRIYAGDRKTESFEEDGYFKYYIAEESNYFVANQILHKCGVNNAFIVAYEGDVKRVLHDAMLAQYKDRMIRDEIEVKDEILKVITVNFEFNEFVLSAEEKIRLQDLVSSQLKTNDEQYVLVNGHTDIRGSDVYNFGLSEERALFVRKMIVGEGISAERVKAFYFGESKLAKYSDEQKKWDESVHQANRRVEIIVLSTAGNN